MGGYIFLIVIGAIITIVGLLIASSITYEFMSGSKRKGMVEEGIDTRRLGVCIGLEGIFIVILTGNCMEKSNPIALYILLPISVIVCGIIIYFICKNNPMKKQQSRFLLSVAKQCLLNNLRFPRAKQPVKKRAAGAFPDSTEQAIEKVDNSMKSPFYSYIIMAASKNSVFFLFVTE